MNDLLRSYGWSSSLDRRLAALADPSLRPGRVVATRRGRLDLATAKGMLEARVAGRRFHPAAAAEPPVVGDWVVFSPPAAGDIVVVREILPRRTLLSRGAAGERAEEQVVAANVDLVAVVMGLDGDYNLRRLERYLVMIDASGAPAAVVLNKTDLCDDVSARLGECRTLAGVAPVVAVSALDGPLDSIEILIDPGRTGALVGSSGAGKTTLINRLIGGGERPTAPVREHDSRGRHTTTHRELFRLPGGGLLIDNPGVREVQPWSAGSALPRVFAEIEELAGSCRFADCRHEGEPGCAVQRAIADGELDPARLASWRRLERESAALERRKDARARREHDRRLGKLYRSVQREKRSRR